MEIIESGKTVLHRGREAREILKEEIVEVTEDLRRRTPTPLEREQMIAQAAYYRALKRNFAPGHELEDWLEAESDLKAQLDWT